MITARQALAVVAAGALFLVMAASFVGIPWPTTQHEIPVYQNDPSNNTGIANSLFSAYAVTLVLIGIVLGAAMIGGVYLAKMEERGKIGP
ncbi:MAG TPA: NADH-quinone oxidoreductase subunit J [Thermoplasmata archaeon]|jgi:NADH:ubiquinone oxidoreductase subunit 6 (subunit J)